MGTEKNSLKEPALQKSIEAIVDVFRLSEPEFTRLIGCPADKFRELTADPEFSFVVSPLRRAVYLIRVFNGLAKTVR